jgi:UDP:flavonoid glycosyltransferase YjiC (YdhE family)
MRVLISTWGMRSHVFHLVPLAWALRAAGHEVLVAGHASMLPFVAEAGLPAVAVGTDLDFAEVFGGRVGRVSDPLPDEPVLDAPVVDEPVVDEPVVDEPVGDEPVRAEISPDGGVVRFADAVLADLVHCGRQFGAQLLVFDPYNLAGPIASAALGIPGVRYLWGPDSTTELTVSYRDIVAPRADRFGVAQVDMHGALTLDPCPAQLQVPLSGPVQPIRYVPFNGAAVMPQWLREPPARPRVCVTWGSMMAGLRLRQRHEVARIVAALGDLDCEVVITVPSALHEHLRDRPPNARLADGPLALHLLLPTCAAIVHQGGAGTMMTALAHGVPQLALPNVSDQHFNARRLAASGAGTKLEQGEGTDAAVREHVWDLLSRASWRDNAARLREQVQAMPTPADVVGVLTKLAAGGSP